MDNIIQLSQGGIKNQKDLIGAWKKPRLVEMGSRW